MLFPCDLFLYMANSYWSSCLSLALLLCDLYDNKGEKGGNIHAKPPSDITAAATEGNDQALERLRTGATPSTGFFFCLLITSRAAARKVRALPDKHLLRFTGCNWALLEV